MVPKGTNLSQNRDLHHLSSITSHNMELLTVFWIRLKSLAVAHVAMIQNLQGTRPHAGES